MTPDNSVVRDIQRYDKDLFIKWNNRKEIFELWRHRAVGSTRITPVVRSIYYDTEDMGFCPVDQRLMWWIYEADTWRHKSAREYAYKMDSRFLEMEKLKEKKRALEYRDRAKDMWCDLNNNYVTRYDSVNASALGKYPKFGNTKTKSGGNWIKPDVQSKFSPRLFSRSTENALKYDWKE